MHSTQNPVIRVMSLILSIVFLSLASMFGDAELKTYLHLYGDFGSFLLLIVIAGEILTYVGVFGEITRRWTLG